MKSVNPEFAAIQKKKYALGLIPSSSPLASAGAVFLCLKIPNLVFKVLSWGYFWLVVNFIIRYFTRYVQPSPCFIHIYSLPCPVGAPHLVGLLAAVQTHWTLDTLGRGSSCSTLLHCTAG